ncbi:hypothetical protein OV090_36260 [Nannocystis sp. RBIL2]|uniref:hypothetical protein n=1 Tax=Nannocystis sp. RBIL2 TaxID=2996788 RepID=UPI002270EE5B|nr:hypothetical protein [Nannocystis sp. RBIL2]MCY1070254.1 hypothetical protein [Nannocystis sp. RBIL2]
MFTSGVDVEVHALAPIAGITVDDVALGKRDSAAALDASADGWIYTADLGGTLRVKLGPGAHSVLATLAE